MNIMGFNIQVPGAGLDLIERYKPVAALLMDIKSQHVAEAKAKSSLTEIIFRKEDGKKWREKDPVRWAQAMWNDVKDCPPNLVVADNEPLGHAAAHEFAALDRWQHDYANWIHANTPMKVGMFSFPEGNFTKDGPVIPDHFPLSMGAADAVFIHEYWRPYLYSDGMEGYHCLRWPYWLEWFEQAGYPDLPIYVTETGITMAVAGGPNDVGWNSEEAKAAGVTEETYLADLDEYHRRCCAGRIKAVLPFVWHSYDWGTFEPTEEMTERMFTIFNAPVPEPEPNGGDKMFPRVFNIEGVELFGEAAEDLVRYHGLTLQYPTLKNGDQFLNLIELYVREGPACFIFTVLKEDGTPWVEAETAWGWTGMDEESNDIEEPYVTDYFERADIGLANDNGNAGPGFGETGWWHDPYEPGPGRAWIRHPSLWAVLLTGIGMEGGTNHRTMYATWRPETYTGEEPLPGDDPVAEIIEYAEKIIERARKLPKTVYQINVVYDDGTEDPFVRATTSGLWAKVKALVGR